ncbi:MAG: S8 family serine peptidase, partial [Candidatus Marinimicrobia bacterium]|nr:S8 family serine peptidase [Candidatus Neomarinimicrobiota bacterium]
MNTQSTFTILFSILIAVLQAEGGAKQVAPRAPSAGQGAPLMGRPFAVAPRDVRPIPGVVMVKLVAGTEPDRAKMTATPGTFGMARLDAVLLRHNVQSVQRTFHPRPRIVRPGGTDLTRIYTLRVPTETDADALVERLNLDPQVEYAERVYPSFVDVAPNDPLYTQQIHFARIMAESAWSIQPGDSSIILAIIDTGVDWDHVDLREHIWQNLGEDADLDGHTIEWNGSDWVLDQGDINGIDDSLFTGTPNGYIDDLIGWDFVDVAAADVYPGEDYGPPDRDPTDRDGHGTHVSGIAAAVTNNDTGVAGTSWNTTIMPVRVGFKDADGFGTIWWAYEGIAYAADNGADIISLSWGNNSASLTAQIIIDYAWGMGSIIIAAAGNDGSDSRYYPAAYDHVLAVGSTSELNDQVSNFSNYGTWVDIFAPGEDILSTYWNDTYRFISGTSMSSPMVAGGVALLKAQFPERSNHDILMGLLAGADNIDAQNANLVGLLGYGRMNLHGALTNSSTTAPNIGAQLVFSDTAFGNGNGFLEPGEKIECRAILENQFLGGVSSNLTVTLSTSDYALRVTTSQATVTALQPLANATTTALVFDIAASAIAHRVVFTLEVSGADGYQKSFSFSAPIGRTSILLVDDDDSGNNVEGYYFKSLDSLGMQFEYWSHMEQG